MSYHPDSPVILIQQNEMRMLAGAERVLAGRPTPTGQDALCFQVADTLIPSARSLDPTPPLHSYRCQHFFLFLKIRPDAPSPPGEIPLLPPQAWLFLVASLLTPCDVNCGM